MDNNKIKAIFADKEFAKKLLGLAAPEDVRIALKEKGIDATLEEIKQLGAQLSAYLEQRDGNGELSDDQLEEVAGGLSIKETVQLFHHI